MLTAPLASERHPAALAVDLAALDARRVNKDMYVFVNIYAAARNNKIEKSPELLIDLLSSALQRDAKKPVLKKKSIQTRCSV